MELTKQIPKIEGTRYALNNSYFKNRKHNYPDTVLEVVQYNSLYNELPFDYAGDDWLYRAMTERQKRHGVQNSQYLTPDGTARQIAGLTDSFTPKDNKVLDACCGTGQLTKCLLDNKLHVTGFDNDPDMVEVCQLVYPQADFYPYDFREYNRHMENKAPAGKWDLIVSNPPHEQKEIIPFFHWLSETLGDGGRAILLLPAGYMEKSSPRLLSEALKRFDVQHREAMQEPFAHTKQVCEICIVGLTESWISGRNATQQTIQPEPSAGTAVQKTKTPEQPENQNPNKDNPQKNKQKIRIMETDALKDVQYVALSLIKPNPLNPRRKVREEDIRELAQSIKKVGLLQAVTLRPKDGGYQIVAGECRYRAFLLNGEESIPAVIGDYTDEEVTLIALMENIQRKNLSPGEESDAFRQLLDAGAYTVGDLCGQTGKSEHYIRGRLRLQNLAPEFRELLDKEEILPGMAFETAKYPKNVQKQVFREYFTQEEGNWKDLGLKDYSGRMEKLYTNDLSKFSFDKAGCGKCPANTAAYELFPGKSGLCTDGACLQAKKDRFTLNFCKVVSEQFPDMPVVIAPYDKMNEGIGAGLKENGIGIRTAQVEEYPAMPQKPVRTDYGAEETYNEALDEYTIEEMSYYKEMEEIEEKIKNGELEKVIYIGSNNPVIGYARVAGAKKEDPLESLQKQDKENKALAVRNAAKEVSVLLQTSDFPGGSLSVFEDELVLYTMLDSLDRKYYPAFGFKDAQKQSLSGEEKYRIAKSATAEQKSLVYRGYLLRRLACPSDSGYASMLLIEFGRQHFAEKADEIVRKHTEIYNKKYQRILKQTETLKEKAKGRGEETEKPEAALIGG